MAEEKKSFNLGKMLEDNGLRLVAPEGPGRYKVIDPKGEERTLNVGQMLADQGMDLKSVDVKVNDPMSPIDISPISAADRAQLSVGNEKGSIGFLKKRFEDVKYTDNGFVVKNQGVWQSVDPSGLGEGSAWDKTKELMKDASDLLDVGIDVTAGVTGAALGAPGGLPGMAAVSAATGATASAIKTSLGRAWGTYDPVSPTEQLTDAAIEAALNATGTFLIPGAKAAASQLAKSVSKLNGTKMGQWVGGLMKESMAKSTEAGLEATETLFANPQRVAAKSAMYERAAGTNPSKVFTLTAQEDLRRANALLSEAKSSLQTKFLQSTKQLAAQAKGSGLVLNNLNLEHSFVQKLEAEGLGTLKNGKFMPLSLSEAQERAVKGAKAMALSDEDSKVMAKAIAEVRRHLNNQKTFRDEGAATAAMQTRKVANDIFRSYIEQHEGSALGAALAKTSAKFREALTEPFYAPGLKRPLGEALEKTSSLYEGFASTVRSAEKLVNQDTGAQTFVNQLISRNPSGGQSRKALAEELTELIGDKATRQIEEIRVNNAVRAFTSRLSGGGVATPGFLKPVVGAIGSPRARRGVVTMSHSLGQWMKQLGPTGRDALLRDAQASMTVMQMLANSSEDEEALTQAFTQMGLGQ